MILAAVPARGPGSYVVQSGAALRLAVRGACVRTLVVDAGFEAEWVHSRVRSHAVQTVIPQMSGRPIDNPPLTRTRRRMKERFGQCKPKYGQGWRADALNSIPKRRFGLRVAIGAVQVPVLRDPPDSPNE